MTRTNAGSFSVLAALLLLSACQNTPVQQTPAHSALTDADLASVWPAAESVPSDGKQAQSVEQAIGGDPCSIRLRDIQEALVLYYYNHRELPAQLQELRTEAGELLPLNCPLSTRPYQYSATGLASPGRSMRILAWDDTPVHSGYRWCIFMSPSRPGQLALDVKPIPESLFATYQPARLVSPPSP